MYIAETSPRTPLARATTELATVIRLPTAAFARSSLGVGRLIGLTAGAPHREAAAAYPRRLEAGATPAPEQSSPGSADHGRSRHRHRLRLHSGSDNASMPSAR